MIKEGTKYISKKTFPDRETLEEVIIPDSVATIDEFTFSGCTALKKVVLPSDLKVIPFGIFSGCTSLSEVIIPDSVTVIQDCAFSGCSSLEAMELPENIFAVGRRAFENAACEGKVTYKGACKRLYKDTLFAAKDHQKHITVPEGVVSLEEYCFSNYTDLETITFPTSLKSIGTNCFSGCSALKEVHFREGMQIGWHSFEKCTSLKTVEIPEKCSVGELAFGYCKNITSVTLPHEGKINWSAFYDCPALEVVYAPEDVDYHQLFKRLPDSCRVLNLDAKEAPGMTMMIQTWEEEVPASALPNLEKLQGLSLEEQLNHCYIVEYTEDESCSYGETDHKITRSSRVLLKKANEFDRLLVKDGNVVGFINMDGKAKFLGDICSSYSSVDSDGTGSSYSSSVSRLEVLDV